MLTEKVCLDYLVKRDATSEATRKGHGRTPTHSGCSMSGRIQRHVLGGLVGQMDRQKPSNDLAVDQASQREPEGTRPRNLDERGGQGVYSWSADRPGNAGDLSGLRGQGENGGGAGRSLRHPEPSGFTQGGTCGRGCDVIGSAKGDSQERPSIAERGTQPPATPIEEVQDHAEMIFGLAALALVGWLAITCVAWAFTPSNTQQRAAANRADWEVRRPAIAEKLK